MKKVAKTRALLLLLATVTTLLALAPPKSAKACLAYEVDSCYERSTRKSCAQSDCARLNTCDGSQTSCVYWRTSCC